MKHFLILTSILIISTFFLACNNSGESEPTPDVTPEITPVSTSTPVPDYVELAIENGGATPEIPASYDPNDGTTIDFSGTVRNNGKDLSGSTEVIYFSVYVDNVSGQSFTDLYTTGEVVGSYGDATGIDSGDTKDYLLDDIDISTSGTTGDNYFYLVVYAYNGVDFELLPDQITSDDNVIQLNTSPCVKSDLPHVSWGGPTTLEGGADSSAAVNVPLFEHWYTSSINFTTPPSYLWYSVDVSSGTTYDIFLDDAGQGSGIYTGNVQLTIYKTNGSDLYSIGDSCYNTPLSVIPTETAILIQVYPNIADGSFAFGIMQQSKSVQ